jgi:predicted dehydrogenase
VTRPRVRTAIVGAGFMGRVHLEALRRVGVVDVVAVASRSVESATRLAEEFGIDRATSDVSELLDDPQINAVHICTPNADHYGLASAALAAGKHVLCEKPLAVSSDEAAVLVSRAVERDLRNCTCHNLRYYPMVQQMRAMIGAGELGEILIVQGTYSQDWLLYDSDWNWRIDAKDGGSSRAMADIGSHWCDMIEHVTGQRIMSVCADLATFHETRRRPRRAAETFARPKGASVDDLEDVRVDSEDYGGVLVRLGDRARGAFTVSQVSAGRKNRLSIEVYGAKASAAWNGERPDELWIGRRDRGTELLLKDPAAMAPEAASYADLPGGHSEGYDDTFKQIFKRFYRSIVDLRAPIDYPQFDDGLRQLRILDAELASHRRRGWVDCVVDKPAIVPA